MQVGDPIAFPPDQWPGPGLYVVTEITQREDGDNVITDATLVNVQFAGQGLGYLALPE
jgi:hypothetical protein